MTLRSWSLRFGFVLLILLTAVLSRPFDPDLGLPLFYQFRGAVDAPEQAIIVGLDKTGVDWLAFNADRLDQNAPDLAQCMGPENWPQLARSSNVEELPRAFLGCLIQLISNRGPGAIVTDIHFYGATDPENDRILEQATAAAGNVILLEKVQANVPNGSALREKPAARFAQHAQAGFFVVEWRSGDTYRYVERQQDFPALPSIPRLTAQTMGVTPPPIEGLGQSFKNLWLYGPAGSVRTVPFIDFVTGDFAESLDGKVVFVGASNPKGVARRDDFETAWSSSRGGDIPGVELGATAFLNIMNGQSLVRLPFGLDVLVIVLAGLVQLAVAFSFSGFRGIVAVVALTIGYVALATGLFTLNGVWLPLTAVLFVFLPVGILISIIRGYLDTSAMLYRFLPKRIASALVREHARERTEALVTDATVMIIDLVGSTRLAGQLGEGEFNRQMTKFFNILNESVEAHSGMVLKYTGDGALALFDTSSSRMTHADRALDAAASIGQRLKVVSTGDTPLSVRIGVSSGRVAVGEIGADSRSSIDVLGNPANIAARLEELGREVSGAKYATILASEYTIELSDRWQRRSLSIGAKEIRGRDNALFVYQVLWDEQPN